MQTMVTIFLYHLHGPGLKFRIAQALIGLLVCLWESYLNSESVSQSRKHVRPSTIVLREKTYKSPSFMPDTF